MHWPTDEEFEEANYPPTELSPEQEALWKTYSSNKVIEFQYSIVAIFNEQSIRKAYKIYQNIADEKYYLYPIDRICLNHVIDTCNLYDAELASLEAGKEIMIFSSITDIWEYIRTLNPNLNPVLRLSPFFIDKRLNNEIISLYTFEMSLILEGHINDPLTAERLSTDRMNNIMRCEEWRRIIRGYQHFQ